MSLVYRHATARNESVCRAIRITSSTLKIYYCVNLEISYIWRIVLCSFVCWFAWWDPCIHSTSYFSIWLHISPMHIFDFLFLQCIHLTSYFFNIYIWLHISPIHTFDVIFLQYIHNYIRRHISPMHIFDVIFLQCIHFTSYFSNTYIITFDVIFLQFLMNVTIICNFNHEANKEAQ